MGGQERGSGACDARAAGCSRGFCRAPLPSAHPRPGQGQWGTLASPSLLLKFFIPSPLLFSLQTACL